MNVVEIVVQIIGQQLVQTAKQKTRQIVAHSEGVESSERWGFFWGGECDLDFFTLFQIAVCYTQTFFSTDHQVDCCTECRQECCTRGYSDF